MAGIDVQSVRFRYRRGFALGPVSLSVDGPGVTALMGPNGAGKSTLIRLLCGVASPAAGRVEVAGRTMARGRRGRAARQVLGYVPQSMQFPQRARLVQVLHHAAWLRRVPRADSEQAVARALSVVDLQDRAGARVRSLSGGMLRRLTVAQALVHDPQVLVLDEPTAGLDPQQRLAMRRYLRSLGERATVLVATHLAEDVTAVADSVVVLGGGAVLYDGGLAELLAAGPGDGEGMSALDAALTRLLGVHPDELAAT